MPSRYEDVVRAISLLLEGRTQKQVAKILGVSDRTVRRWKNEGVTPAPANLSKLVAKAENRARYIIHGRRRRLKEYDPKGKPTGGTYESAWINFTVSHLDSAEKAHFARRKTLRYLQRSDRVRMQLFVEYAQMTTKGVWVTKRTGLMIEDVSDYSLEDFIESIDAAESSYDDAQVVVIAFLA